MAMRKYQCVVRIQKDEVAGSNSLRFKVTGYFYVVDRQYTILFKFQYFVTK